MKPNALLIGLVAGIASALLFAGLVTQSPGAVVLALAAPVPVLLASLGWGSKAGFVAALTAFAAIAGFLGSPMAGLTILLGSALPSAVIGHMAGLARPVDSPAPSNGNATALDWYPLRRLLFAIALLSAGSCLALGWIIGYDPSEIEPAVAAALTSQTADGVADPEQIREFSRFVVGAIPFVQPAFLTLTLVVCLYLSAAVVRLSGRLQRPRDDLPRAVTLPRMALPVFAVAMAASFASGGIGILGAVFVGALATAFTCVGLASVHRRTRGKPARGLLLFTTYAAILLLSFPLLAFLVLGLFETAKPPVVPAQSN